MGLSSISLNSNPMEVNVKRKLSSRKLWVSVVTVVVLLVNAIWGVDLDPEIYIAATLPAIAYVLGEAWVDSSHKN
mgnify:CR=1 FL=1